MKCYQYNNQGYFLFVAEDYGQGLPHNATYLEPPKEKDGYLLKFNGESWEHEEVPKEEKEAYTPTQQDLLDQLNAITSSEMTRIGNDFSLSLANGSTLKEAQPISQEEINVIVSDYNNAIAIINNGGNPFESEE